MVKRIFWTIRISAVILVKKYTWHNRVLAALFLNFKKFQSLELEKRYYFSGSLALDRFKTT